MCCPPLKPVVSSGDPLLSRRSGVVANCPPTTPTQDTWAVNCAREPQRKHRVWTMSEPGRELRDEERLTTHPSAPPVRRVRTGGCSLGFPSNDLRLELAALRRRLASSILGSSVLNARSDSPVHSSWWPYGMKSGDLLAVGLSQAGVYYLGQFPVACSEGYAQRDPVL